MILNKFIELTKYNRSYTARALRIKEVLGYLNMAGKRIKYVADKRKIKRKKKKTYPVRAFLCEVLSPCFFSFLFSRDKKIVKVVPFPNLLSTEILPLCSFMIF